jgi:hypothetical protein
VNDNTEQILRLRLKQLAYARSEFQKVRTFLHYSELHTIRDVLSVAMREMAHAEGEIEQAIFGARGASE